MPSPGRTLYDILGLTPGASAEAIASAYQAKSIEIDSTHDATVAIREAYQVLSNPERRKKYDAKLAAGVLAAATRAVPGHVSRRSSRRLTAFVGMSALALLASIVGWKLIPAPPPATVAATVAPRTPEPEPAAEEEETPREEVASTPPAAVVAPPPVITAPVLVGKELPANEMVARFWPSIVRISTTDPGGRFLGQGSGVYVERDTVITNCHVLKGAHAITVRDYMERPAILSVADEELDLCRLRVANMSWPQVLTLGTLGDLRTGQRVYAMGAPWQDEHAIAEGTITSLNDHGNGVVIQIATPVPPSWDGGGLFTTDGRLVGVLTRRQSFGSDSSAAVPVDWIQNMRPRRVAFPTPADTPREVAASLIGKWRCKGFGRRNGVYEYGADGIMKILYDSDGRTLTAPYRLEGMTIYLRTDHSGEYRLQIESIGAGGMIKYFEPGRRINCQRET